jgi:hypothetical protein
MPVPSLCGVDGCRRLSGHLGDHDGTPTEVWTFLGEKDQKKLDKAGYATPRGGRKGAYQNHVVRTNRVIVPFEKLHQVPLDKYKDGYVVRLYPEQYFETAGVPKAEFMAPEAKVEVGSNAFVLYRSHVSFDTLPPLAGWIPRRLLKDGVEVTERRKGVVDDGHYVLRLPAFGKGETKKDKHELGPPQGLFAPEYADEDTNYLAQCVLAWLIVHSAGSPYVDSDAPHLRAVLEESGLLSDEIWEFRGVMRHSITACPLCSRLIAYSELHSMLQLDAEQSLENAATQVEGATRSTIVNLFHMEPMTYGAVAHTAQNVAWGHAVCNTKLGQRKCYSLNELRADGLKLGIILPRGIETFGFMSADWEMIRSPNGSVWIRLTRDIPDDRPVSELTGEAAAAEGVINDPEIEPIEPEEAP